jgi:hypothetical protein
MQMQLGFAPEALQRRPPLDAPLRWYLEAFYDLSRGRQITMGGAGPIPLSEILAYMQMFEITDLDERASFLRTMGRLDAVYLEAQHKKAEARKVSQD